ncbi:binding-protein-dependent transport systems inner membrane component [Xylanimonas cellulosilytica DSM 15894]|uniref:Binding-protein-dependent transport systems inner membrane component n=1 Tax=Xylanimonas cellulosilytica (strain DSM 15894 / JCM 12276 / CECT 5975 / KCTC 9989 / LMG 20990 / NBRC 107835 / XIL07) TaxID=446471 RepID=D1BYD7_XYLCX|nr:carbohydrate ABC transporter permease [Xylanimonas cellulosilytica]ACZ31809.1 binding-protein-dependent transport systems inner membrane component [Xylanimonas cellulosilytica DSM 15894]
MTTATLPPKQVQAALPRVRRDRSSRLSHKVFVYLGVAAIVVYCLAPFYWMIVSSLRRGSDIFDKSAWPSPVSFENYLAVFDTSRGFGQAIVNSVIVAGTTTVLALFVAIITSYALARLHFRAKRLVLTVIVATSMFPLVAIIVPLLKLFTAWGWINTYQSMIVPGLSFALPLAVWNLTSFFKQMPAELEQAAMIDGCSRGQAFRLVILPLAAPGVFTTAIIVFVSAWNEFLIALTMVNKASMQTAPVAISKFVGATQFEQPFGSQMAAGVVVTIPLVILVLLFQRRIVAGLASGGVKS